MAEGKQEKWRYNFDLVDLNYVLMKDVDQNFIDGLKNEYIKMPTRIT